MHYPVKVKINKLVVPASLEAKSLRKSDQTNAFSTNTALKSCLNAFNVSTC